MSPSSDLSPAPTGTHILRDAAQDPAFAWKLLNALPCAVVITDEQGNTTWVNQGFREICGYGPDEVVGKKPGSLLQGPATDPTTVSRIRAALQAGHGCSERILNYDKRGRSYWISLDIARFEIAGQAGFIGIARDLTQGFADNAPIQEQVARVSHVTEAVGHLAQAANEEPELHQFFLSLADAVASLKPYK